MSGLTAAANDHARDVRIQDMPIQDNRQLRHQIGFSVAILACFAPLLFLHFRQLWAYQHYQFFPLLLVALPILIWTLWTDDPVARPISPRWYYILLTAGLAGLAIAVLAWSPNLAALGFALTAGAVLLGFYQQGRLLRFAPLWGLFFLLIKLPLDIDIDLIFWLQGLTSSLAGRLIDFVGVNHLLSGHIIQTPGDKYLVEEACSGIQSLFTLIAVAGIFLTVYRRPRHHSIAFLGLAAFWACAINIGRVAGVVIAKEKFGLDVSTGTAHEIFGLVLFGLALGLLFSSDRLLLLILESDHVVDINFDNHHATGFEVPGAQREPEPSEDADNSAPPHRFVMNRANYAIAAAFGILLLFQLTALALQSTNAASIDPDDPRMAAALSETVLPEAIGRWNRTEFSTESRSLTNYLGRNTATWVYESQLGKAYVAIDFPFLGWHELTGCYEAQGCAVSGREILETQDADIIQPVFAQVSGPDGKLGSLWFSEFFQSGEPVIPLGNNAGTVQYWLSRVHTSFLRQTAALRTSASNYQVQLLFYSDRELSEADSLELQSLHEQTSLALVKVIREATK